MSINQGTPGFRSRPLIIHRAFLLAVAMQWAFACSGANPAGSTSSSSSGGGSQGAEGRDCFPNGTCFTGLTCLSNLCVRLPGSSGGGASSAQGSSSASSSGGGALSSSSASSGSSAGSGGSRASSSGGSGSSVSSGGTGGSSGGTSPLAEFFRAVDVTMCQRQVECGSGFYTAEECESRASPTHLDGVTSIQPTAQAPACLEALAQMPCSTAAMGNVGPGSQLGPVLVPACTNAVVGTLPAGAACVHLGCQAGLVCTYPSPATNCPQGAPLLVATCQTPRSLGAACDGHFQCQDGLGCRDAVCQVPLAPGQPCAGNDLQACGPLGFCLTGVCQRWAYLGEGCGGTTHATCRPPLHCNGNGVCAFEVSNGEDCDLDAQCPAGAGCVTNTCQPAAAPGLFCDTPADCQSGACDRGASNCRGTLTAGQACVDHNTCALGLFCPNGLCQPPGGAGTSCTADRHCLGGTWCPDGASSTCQPLGEYGDPCSFSGNRGCGPDFHCEGRDNRDRILNTCQVRGLENAQCWSDASCVDGLRCQAGTCRRPGAEGEPCTGAVGFGSTCATHLVCSESMRCERPYSRPVGASCPANSYEFCASGSCNATTLLCEGWCAP